MANADRISMANRSAQVDAEISDLMAKREMMTATDYRARMDALRRERAALERAIEFDWASEQNAGSVNALT
ncbi:MAG: hypothetical protein JXO22_17510 [Phycisphaerae bacterium]|nr:hypothetical protein [Phycisphaerae bacterium]